MLDVSFTHLSVNPQSWRFANNSLGLPHARKYFLCLPVSMSLCRVCMLSALPVCLSVLIAQRVSSFAPYS